MSLREFFTGEDLGLANRLRDESEEPNPEYIRKQIGRLNAPVDITSDAYLDVMDLVDDVRDSAEQRLLINEIRAKLPND